MIDLITTDFKSSKIHLKISIGLLKIIVNSAQIVLDDITYAFRGRMGCFPEEIVALKDKIFNQAVVNLYDPNIDLSFETAVIFCFKEIMLINDCLNEVCHGLKIDDFENRVGFSKDALLSEINPIAKQILQIELLATETDMYLT
jgi:hypothetical protein